MTTRSWGFSCYNCRESFNGDYDGTPAAEDAIENAAGEAGWVLGTDFSGQGHYACPDCAASLYNASRIKGWRCRVVR